MKQKKLRNWEGIQKKNDYVTKYKEHEKTEKRIEKVVITANRAENKEKNLENYIELGKILRTITGQTGQLLRAKKSIAGWKVMKGEIIGIMITLRKERMESFLEKWYFMVLIGETGAVFPKISAEEGQIQCGSPLMFLNLKYDKREKYGWNIGIQLTKTGEKARNEWERTYKKYAVRKTREEDGRFPKED